MRTTDNEQQTDRGGNSYRELRLLEEIQRTPEISQRQLARQLGVALGVANALVRSLARHGYIRATQVGWKRWVYALTPSGINRKLQLTLEYIDNFLDHYSRVRLLLHDDLSSLDANSDSQLAVHGITELAELIYLALLELGLENVEFIAEDPTVSDFLGRPVKSLESAVPEEYVKVIVAFPRNVGARYEALTNGGFASEQIVTLLSGSSVLDSMNEGSGQFN